MTKYDEFCDRWLASWTGNQPAALAEFYTADAHYSDPANPKGLLGREALLVYFTRLLAKNPAWQWSRVETYEASDGFFLKWRAEIPTAGKVVECVGLDRVVMRDGKIARNEVYFDTAPWVLASVTPRK